MKKKNDFEYEENGVIIVFTPVALRDGETVKRYVFSVQGNAELTEKLRRSVKRKKVKKKDIPFCAKALFSIIKEGDFREIASDGEVESFFILFQQEVRENPVFDMVDNSKPNMPFFTAMLINKKLAHLAIQGTGRTKSDAKTEALKNFFLHEEVLRKTNLA